MNSHPLPRRAARWFAIFFGVAAAGAGAVALLAADHDHAPRPAGANAAEAHDHGSEADGHADEARLTPEAVARYGVRVEPVNRRQLKPTFAAPARVSFNAEATAHVGSAVKGRVAELNVRVGDEVKKGDVLAVVESPELGEAQLDFIQRRATRAAADPPVEAARSAAERGRKLYDESNGISLTEVQKRETEYQAARAAAQAAQTAAAAAEGRLRLLGMDAAAVHELGESGRIRPQFAVRAPLAGRVIERAVTPGEMVGPEREHLMVLADVSVLWVLADVPEARLRGLAKGTGARIAVAAVSDVAVTGAVSFVGPTVDPATRTAQVRIEVKNDRGELKPGMFATAEIDAGGNGNDKGGAAVLAVPAGAVQTVEGGPAVFVPVEGEENTFARRAVTAGKPVGGWVPILAGLKEGDRVVVAGSFILKAELGKSGAAHEH